MSTGSIASDAEDFSPCQRRTTRGTDYHNSHRCTEDDEEEFDDRVHGKAKPQPTTAQLSNAPQRESRQCQRNAANARERARMRVLSKGFSRLKTTLPWVPADTKLSKLDTLRLASSYISHLRQLLQDERFERSFVHPVNLTWPFVMSGRLEEKEDNIMTSAGRTLCGASA
ncbi:transcription factor 21 [Gadus chalcogrammus]|uniref:transcription factor 21 n=1 Tax=Gadus chalcogrammus TaxID=1042646 RepID=UPI0024C487E9|nr:transcription factor 21 [Gadus chalcogrammus]